MEDSLINYFINDYEVATNKNTKRKLPSSVLIINKDDLFERGASLMLQLAIKHDRLEIFS